MTDFSPSYWNAEAEWTLSASKHLKTCFLFAIKMRKSVGTCTLLLLPLCSIPATQTGSEVTSRVKRPSFPSPECRLTLTTNRDLNLAKRHSSFLTSTKLSVLSMRNKRKKFMKSRQDLQTRKLRGWLTPTMKFWLTIPLSISSANRSETKERFWSKKTSTWRLLCRRSIASISTRTLLVCLTWVSQTS